MQSPVRAGNPSSRSSYRLCLGPTSPVRISNRHAPQPRHGLRRGWYSLGRPRVEPPRAYLRRRLALVASTGRQFRRVVPFTRFCTSARLHRSYCFSVSRLRVTNIQRRQTSQFCDHPHCSHSTYRLWFCRTAGPRFASCTSGVLSSSLWDLRLYLP